MKIIYLLLFCKNLLSNRQSNRNVPAMACSKHLLTTGLVQPTHSVGLSSSIRNQPTVQISAQAASSKKGMLK